MRKEETGMGEILLETKKLSKHFGGIIANEKIDFSIDRGEIVAIIGPNGSGKTTFYNLLTGITPSTSGSIWFEGKNITKKKPEQITKLGIICSESDSIYFLANILIQICKAFYLCHLIVTCRNVDSDSIDSSCLEVVYSNSVSIILFEGCECVHQILSAAFSVRSLEHLLSGSASLNSYLLSCKISCRLDVRILQNHHLNGID